MKVDIAVCGRFHYHNYVKVLDELGVLNRLYTSYKLNFDFGITNGKHINYAVKEYLMYFNIRFLNYWNFPKNMMTLHRLWEYQVSRNDIKSDILHVMIHGNSERFIKEYKNLGKVIIGEAVNAHPDAQIELINHEKKKYELNKNSCGAKTTDELAKTKMLREFELCDYILAPSSFVKESFVDRGFDSDRIFVLPYGTSVSSNFFFKKRISESKINILCVAQLSYRKGQINLLNAVNKFKEKHPEKDISITLVGGAEPEYKKLIEEHVLFDTLSYIEHIPHQNMFSFMQKFDLLVLPSLEDGFGLVVSEALSVGLPVICSRNAGASELIINGKNGLLIDPFSVSDIAHAIEEAMGSTFELDSDDLKSWEEYSEDIQGIYKRVLL